MPDWLPLGALALASTVNSAIPGPCVALTVARTSRGGVGAGLAVAGGILAADAALATLALAALLGLVEISEGLVARLRWPAAAVMVAMGLRMLALARRPAGAHAAARPPGGGDFCAGALVCLASPYNLVFFLALLPLYAGAEALTGARAALMGAALLAGSAAAYLAAVAIGAASGRLAGGGARWIEAAGALSLIGFGLVAVAAPLG